MPLCHKGTGRLKATIEGRLDPRRLGYWGAFDKLKRNLFPKRENRCLFKLFSFFFLFFFFLILFLLKFTALQNLEHFCCFISGLCLDQIFLDSWCPIQRTEETHKKCVCTVARGFIWKQTRT